MAETATAPVSNDAVGQEGAKLDTLLQQMLSRGMQQPAQLRQPTPRYGQEEMQQGKYMMGEQGSKKGEIGASLANFGTFIHNAVAQHKQRQVHEAMSEWEGLNNAYVKAQTLAGDPSAPDYQQKVMQMLQQDPYVKANLDPANPKAQKRLKNMYKALNVDITDDKQNVHREGLKRFFQAKQAFDKVKQAGQAVAGHKQQKPQMDPQERMQGFRQSLDKLVQQSTAQPMSMKDMESVARIMEAKYGRDEALAWKEQFAKQQMEMLDMRLDAADRHQQEALNAANERQDKALLAHTELMQKSFEHQEKMQALRDQEMDKRFFARLDSMGLTKGFNVNAQGKAQKMDLKQGQDVPDSWISEKDAEAIATPTQQGRNRAEASKVIQGLMPEIDRMLGVDDKKLGAVAGRYSDFKAGKIGMNDPDFVYLTTLSELAKSATAMMHLGLRGAASSISKGNTFIESLDTGKMSPDNIRAGINAIKILTKEYAEEGTVAPIGSAEWNKRYSEAKHMATDDDFGDYKVK